MELLSPHEMGSLRPTRLGPTTTKVRRTKVDRRPEQLRTLGIAVGAFLIVTFGVAAGMLVVMLAV